MVEEPNPISKRRVVWSLNIVAFSWSVGLGAAVPVIPILAYQLEPNVALAGLVITMGGAGRLWVSFLTGYMLDRFGRRRVAIVGVTVRMIFSFAEGLSPTYYMLVFSRFMSGVGTAIWGTGLATITADISTRADRGAITGGRQGFTHLGAVLGPVLGAAAWAATGDIRVPFFINGFSKLICLVVFLVVMVETRTLSEAEATSRDESSEARRDAKLSYWATWSAVLASGFILALAGLFLTGLFRSVVVDTFVPLFVREELGHPQSVLGFVLSGIGLGGLGASFIGGRIADRVGVGAVLVPGAMILVGGMVLLTLGPDSVLLVLLGVMLGAGATLIQVGTQAFAIDISPPGRRGRFFGQTQAAVHFASLVGPVAIGAIAGWWGFANAFFLLAALFGMTVPIGIVMARHKASQRGQPAPA